jgi:hypothetical protein
MTILRGSNCTHLEAITYIKRWKSISKMSVVSQAREGGTTTMGYEKSKLARNCLLIKLPQNNLSQLPQEIVADEKQF